MKVSLKELLTLEIAVKIHDTIITKTGGAQGVREESLILSALASPFYALYDQELYPTPIEKAGIAFFAIIKNHGFVDGNKRTACLFLDLILYNFGYELKANNRDIEKIAVDIADNKVSKEKVFLWIHHNIGFIKK